MENDEGTQAALNVNNELLKVYDDLMARSPLEEIFAGTAMAYKDTSNFLLKCLENGERGSDACSLAADYAHDQYLRVKKQLPRSTYYHSLWNGYYGAYEYLEGVRDYWYDSQG